MPHHRAKPSLATHLWLMGSVLTEFAQQPDGPDGELTQSNISSAFYRYIVARSCKKIHTRLSSAFSEGFIQSLKSLRSNKVPFPDDAQWVHSSVGSDREKDTEGRNDYWLLNDFLSLTTNDELHLLTVNLPILSSLKTSLDKSQAPIDYSTFVIYNDDTCREFHELLNELIGLFKAALKALSDPHGKPGTEDYRAPGSQDCFEHFSKNMLDAQLYGYALLKLSRGRAFRMHMQNVAHMLVPVETNVPVPPQETVGDNEAGENHLEADDELDAIEALQPSNTKGVKWLRLMVAHLDALDIILLFVRSKNFTYNSIDATLLLAPLAEKELYPWKELLINKTYFPDSAADNGQLVKFLEDNMVSALHARGVSHLAKAICDVWDQCIRNPTTTKHYEDLKIHLKAMGNTSEAVLKTLVEAATTNLELWHATEDILAKQEKLNSTNTSILAIFDHKHPLPDGNDFFCSLKKLRFGGAIHCEATLATLVNNFARHKSYRESDQYRKYIQTELETEMQVNIFFSICLLSHSHLLPLVKIEIWSDIRCIQTLLPGLR